MTITGGLSGGYSSACAAKRIYEENDPSKSVFALDSLSAGPEITMIIEKLVEFVKKGLPYSEICDKIREYSKKTGLIFMRKGAAFSSALKRTETEELYERK